MSIDLRCGRYQDVMRDVRCDLFLVDAPYSGKTHASHTARTDVLTACERDARWAARGGKRNAIDYAHWNECDVDECVDFWAPRTDGWMVSITDHVLGPVWERAMRRHGRYVFPPLPFLETGSRVRLTGDGPSSWTCWVIVSSACWMVVGRPRSFSKWGTLPGAYVATNERKEMMGAKPIGLLRQVVKDYSRPGDIVADACSGSGSTLLAALMEGRSAIGSERSYATAELASYRIERALAQQSLFTATREEPEQASLLLDGTGGR